MGLAYYRLPPEEYSKLEPLIEQHENDILSPRARSYWFDRPDDYPYEEVRAVAQNLDRIAAKTATESLQLSEHEAHGLSMLGIELTPDRNELQPTLFLTSLNPDGVKRAMLIARRQLGSTPEHAAEIIHADNSDNRFAGYMAMQLGNLRKALPKVWHFHERALSANEAIVIVDLRARDLDIPEEVELLALQ